MSVEIDSHYHPTSEQLALGISMSKALSELLPLSRLHASRQETLATWDGLEHIGIFRMCVSEAHGGSGLGAVEEALIAMQLGTLLASPAILATIGAAHARLLGDAAAVRTAAAYRRADRCIIVDEAGTALILLRDARGAALHGLSAGSLRPLDDQLWLGTLREVTDVGEPLARFDDLQLARLRLLDAAALSGMAQAVLAMSVDYAATREQFGRPIGSFQAIKHHCANMAMSARCARDQTNFAAVALDEGRDDAPLQVECALLVAGTAALENASKNIQIHGAMGFSDEADPHLFLKRAQLQLAIAGGLDAATARVANAKGEG